MTKEDLDWVYFHTTANKVLEKFMEGDMDKCSKIPTKEMMEAISEFNVLADNACKYIDEIVSHRAVDKIARKIIGMMTHHITHEYCNYEVCLSAVERGKRTEGELQTRLLILTHDTSSCLRFINQYIHDGEPTEIRLYDENRYMSKFKCMCKDGEVVVKRTVSEIEIPYEKVRLKDTIERTGKQVYRDMLAELESGKYDKYVILEK